MDDSSNSEVRIETRYKTEKVSRSSVQNAVTECQTLLQQYEIEGHPSCEMNVRNRQGSKKRA